MATFYEYSRKPNYKKWVCPLDGRILNSRGAPSYLRNKYHVPWDKEYLLNPHLLCNGSDYLNKDKLFIKIRGLFPTLEEKNDELVGNISTRLFSITSRIRTAIEKKNIPLLEEIHKRLLTASKFTIIKHKKKFIKCPLKGYI